MENIKRTKKLMAAIEVLGDERMADCTEEAFVVALRKGKTNVEQIYRIMAMMGYRWKPKLGYWAWTPRRLLLVRRVFAIVNKEDEPIVARMMEE